MRLNEITKKNHNSLILKQGYFGKGSFSRGCPRSARKNHQPEIIRERQWKRRCEWSGLQENDPMKQGDSSGNSYTQHETEVIVIADTDTEGEDFISQLKPRYYEFNIYIL